VSFAVLVVAWLALSTAVEVAHRRRASEDPEEALL
jgi:hypothetical protein